MAIYGTAVLSISLIVGLVVGKLIGLGMGIDANVGGVGIAMLLLIAASTRLQQSGHLSKPTRAGVLFWSSIYIPIVVAMAASQNVRAAITGGPAAILAGTLAVAVCFALVPVISHRPDADDADGVNQASSTGGDEL